MTIVNVCVIVLTTT